MAEERYNKILNRLPNFWNKEKDSQTAHLIKSFSDELEDYTIEVNNLHSEIYVQTATGKRLDELGRLFKLSRKLNESDDAFRVRIIAYWPGFSGGGTIPAIKSTVNKITGIPEDQVEVEEASPPVMKFRANISFIEPGQEALKETIRETIWGIKTAGVYPFFNWIINGNITSEDLSIMDSVDVYYITTENWFIWEVSLIDSNKLIW
jgi:hypothetical protein